MGSEDDTIESEWVKLKDRFEDYEIDVLTGKQTLRWSIARNPIRSMLIGILGALVCGFLIGLGAG